MEYRPQLDSLRAIAVVAVLYSHFMSAEPPFGHLGVRLFFVLSGFLITGILLRDGMTLSFYVNRAARLWPLLYVTLAASFALDLDGMRDTWLWHLAQASNVFFFSQQSWDVAWPANHLWTVNVEQQFYLFWPFVICLTPRKWLPIVLALIAAVGPAYRYLVDYDELAAALPPASFDALAAGGLLALIPSRVSSRAVYALAAVAFPLCVYGLAARDKELVEITSVGVFCGLVLAGSRGDLKVLEQRWLAGLGKISYGVYLLHPFVWALGGKLGGPDAQGWKAFVVMSSVTIALAYVSFRWFERPVRVYVSSLLSRPAPAPGVS